MQKLKVDRVRVSFKSITGQHFLRFITVLANVSLIMIFSQNSGLATGQGEAAGVAVFSAG
ncbi:hypothetical protein BH11CYA1_BH11CYA1_05460 [soil metagenome]